MTDDKKDKEVKKMTEDELLEAKKEIEKRYQKMAAERKDGKLISFLTFKAKKRVEEQIKVCVKAEKDRLEWNNDHLGFNEDTSYVLKNEIRWIKKQIQDLEKEKIRTADNKKEVDRKIKELKKLEVEKSSFLALEIKTFRDPKRKSGIDIAKEKSKLEKLIKQEKALCTLFYAWTLFAFGFVIIFFLSFIPCILFPKFDYRTQLSISIAVFFIIILLIIIAKNYKEVPHMEEWQMRFAGTDLCAWEPGPKIIFPLFMDIFEPVYMGTNSIEVIIGKKTGGESDDGEKKTVKNDVEAISFRDGGSAKLIIAEIFFRIFDSNSAAYEIDSLVYAVSEKMEAGLRAFYSSKTTDEAIETREDLNIRQIITLPACEAEHFKEWGVEIMSIAIKALNLTSKTEEDREKIFTAIKDVEKKEYEKRSAVEQALIDEILGEGEGKRLARLKNGADIGSGEAVEFLVSMAKWKAGEKAQSLILSNSSDGSASSSALAGAAAAAGINSMKKPEKTDEDKTGKTVSEPVSKKKK